jgi:hypothetical protein
MRRFAPQASGRRRLAAQARLRLAQESRCDPAEGLNTRQRGLPCNARLAAALRFLCGRRRLGYAEEL